MPARLSREHVIDARQAVRAGESVAAIARRLDLGYSGVHHAVQGTTWRSVTDPPPYQFRPYNGRAASRSLSDTQVREIRAAHAAGQSARSLGRAHNVSPRTISGLLRGETYRDVPDQAPAPADAEQNHHDAEERR